MEMTIRWCEWAHHFHEMAFYQMGSMRWCRSKVETHLMKGVQMEAFPKYEDEQDGSLPVISRGPCHSTVIGVK